MKRSAARFGPEDGQAVILVVVAMSILLIGALGLAIDGGQMYAQRQMAQAAADAAAQAGIMSIFTGTNATSAHPFGTTTASTTCTTGDLRTPCVYALDNGFGGTAADVVTLSFPAAATILGAALSPTATVPALTVTVQRTLNTGLIRMVGGAATSVITAKATAGLVGTVSPSCMYVLDPSAADALQVTNGATVTMNGCSIIVDSTSSTAMLVNGGSHVTATAINVVGGASVTNGAVTTPTPTTGIAPVADPFLSVPAPAIGACDHPTNYHLASGTFTLNPGVYCGGISLTNNGTYTFNPGTYILNGGGISFASGTSTGSGVMFYLTGTNATYNSVTISNGANVVFSAETSGPYLGLLFYQDRTITSSANAVFNGGASMQLTGSLYFPTTDLSYSNGSSAVTYSTGLVAKQIVFSGGSANVSYDPTGLKTGLFSTSVALVQ